MKAVATLARALIVFLACVFLSQVASAAGSLRAPALKEDDKCYPASDYIFVDDQQPDKCYIGMGYRLG